MGDEGSGYHIGVSALRAVAAATDRCGPPTALTAAMLDSLGLDRPRQLPGWAESASKADIAALAPLAIHTARSGDAPATAVIRRALHALGDQLSAAIRDLFPSPSGDPPTVALAGGLISPDGPLRADTEQLVASAAGHLLPRAVIPERGAARLALTLVD